MSLPPTPGHDGHADVTHRTPGRGARPAFVPGSDRTGQATVTTGGYRRRPVGSACETYVQRSLLGLLALLVLAPGVPAQPASDEARLLRFPAVHGQSVVFSYAGNLYAVPADGG